MISYPIPNSKQYITISTAVIKKLTNNIQKFDNPERGGLLFADFKLPEIYISDISLPYKNDIQKTYYFIPDQEHQQREIVKKFQKGLHFVGEWHTHPQRNPEPSILDINSMRASFLKSNHELNYFILIILSNTENFNNTWISIHDSIPYIKLYHRNYVKKENYE